MFHEQEQRKSESTQISNKDRIIETLHAAPTEENLWKAVVACQNITMKTYSGLSFSYEIRRGRNGEYNKELWVDRRENSKAIVWSSVRLAFQKISKLGEVVERPKALGDIRGVTYIYGIFYYLGLIDAPEKARGFMGRDTLEEALAQLNSGNATNHPIETKSTKEESRVQKDEKLDITNEEVLTEEEEKDVDEDFGNNELTAYDIAVFYNTYNLSTLMKWWDRRLIVPQFQRPYVWSQKKASEFVDSILRGLPVPSMFFYDDNENNRLLVVDGQQRLRSLYAFMIEKKFAGKPFELIGNIHRRWAGKTYDTLEQEDRERLDDVLLNITVMRQLLPEDGRSSMYLAFQRINTGGITLKAQEIRMAVSYGEFAEYLGELSRDERFERWKFLRTQAQRDNGNYSPVQEFILKVFAYYFSYPKFSGSSTRTLLDEFFDEQKEFDHPKKKLAGRDYHSRQEFEKVLNAVFDVVYHLSDEDISPYSKPTQTFLEAVWVGLIYRKLNLKKEINTATLPQYIAQWKQTMGEEKFQELFQARRTSSTRSAFDRIDAGIRYFAGDF